MAFSRYSKTPRLNLGGQLGTGRAAAIIRSAIAAGTLNSGQQIILRGNDRLDSLAGAHYGDSRYWWIIAAASNIGWGLQVPPGTILYFPDLDAVAALVG